MEREGETCGQWRARKAIGRGRGPLRLSGSIDHKSTTLAKKGEYLSTNGILECPSCAERHVLVFHVAERPWASLIGQRVTRL